MTRTELAILGRFLLRAVLMGASFLISFSLCLQLFGWPWAIAAWLVGLVLAVLMLVLPWRWFTGEWPDL